MKFKKAIEPLIATILLVVVAVILVTIVLAWGKNFSTEGLNKTNDVINDSCSGATIAISNCDYNTNTGVVTAHLKNTSSSYSFIANDFKANVTDDANALHYDMDTALTTAALGPGQTIVATISPAAPADINGATRVTVNVRSNTCPNIAVSEITGCS